MTHVSNEIKKRVPGILYLLLAITGFYTPHALEGFSNVFDSSEWFEFILQKESLFISGILSFFLMNIIWLLLALSFYWTFKVRNEKLSSILLLSVISGSILVFAIILLKSFPLYLISLISKIPDSEKQHWIEKTHFIFMLSMKGNMASFLFYSIWLFPLAFLFLKERSLSKVERIGLFLSLCIAGMGYFADFLIFHILPGSDIMGVTDFTFYGEVVILLWLLVKGLDRKEDSH